MHTVKIKVSPDQLAAVTRTMEVMDFEPTANQLIKAQRSILKQVRVKLFKKQLDTAGKTKPISITLKYYEAYALEQYIRDWLWLEQASYENTLTVMAADDINKKLV